MQNENSNSSQGSAKDKEPKKRKWACIYTDPMPTVAILMSLITVLMAIVIGVMIFQVFDIRNFQKKMKEAHSELEDFRQEQRDQMTKKMKEARAELEDFTEAQKKKLQESVVMLINYGYSLAIDRYTQLLAGNNPGQKTTAIWALLNILNETKDLSSEYPGLFDEIVGEYVSAIPYLKLDIAKDEFTDSYRGKVWIWIILLESENEYIKNAICDEIEIENEIKNEPKLSPKLLDDIFQYNKSKLTPDVSLDFEKSIERLKPFIESLTSLIQEREAGSALDIGPIKYLAYQSIQQMR